MLLLIFIHPLADKAWVIGIQISNPGAKKIRTFLVKSADKMVL